MLPTLHTQWNGTVFGHFELCSGVQIWTKQANPKRDITFVLEGGQ